MLDPKKSGSDCERRRTELEGILESTIQEYETFKTVEKNKFQVRMEARGNCFNSILHESFPHSDHSLRFFYYYFKLLIQKCIPCPCLACFVLVHSDVRRCAPQQIGFSVRIMRIWTRHGR